MTSAMATIWKAGISIPAKNFSGSIPSLTGSSDATSCRAALWPEKGQHPSTSRIFLLAQAPFLHGCRVKWGENEASDTRGLKSIAAEPIALGSLKHEGTQWCLTEPQPEKENFSLGKK